MTQVTTIGLDLAKRIFQVHGMDAAGAVVLRRQLKRRQMVPFFTKLPNCLIGMEAYGTAHHWARTLQALGHAVRLIPPAYAKAYVRRNKTDPADAEAICEAVSRPSMRFVPIKSEADQAMAAVHRVRERLIAQRTQTINMLRGQMAEFGVVAAKGPQHVKALVAELAEPESVPEPLRQVLLGLVRLITALSDQIAVLDKQILAWHRANPCSRRLSAIDGFGPILSSALALRVQQPQRFACGRDLSAWIGLAPKQNSSGGKVRIGAISKKGDVYLRRLLINGAQAVLNSKRAKTDPWIARLLHSKPRLVVAVAVANKMARIAGAVMVRQTEYQTDFRRPPAAALRPPSERRVGSAARELAKEKVHTDVGSRPTRRGRPGGSMGHRSRGLDIEIPTLRSPPGPAVMVPHLKGRTHDCNHLRTSAAISSCESGAIHT